jgi:predicted Zn-dependent protease
MDEHRGDFASAAAPTIAGDSSPPVPAAASTHGSPTPRNRFLRALDDRRRLVRLLLVLAVLGVGGWMLASRFVGWYHLHAGKAALDADHCDVAFAELQLALAAWPDDAEVQFLTARAARRSGAFGAADQLLTQCEAAPALAEAVVLERVLLRASRGEVDEVASFCRSQLEQNHPETPLILEALAQGYTTALRYPDASNSIERWLEQSPNHPHALYLKGRLQAYAGNQHEAVGLLARVVELDPERDDARLQLAALYLDLGEAREAQPHLEWLRRRQPDHLLVQVRMARCLDFLGRQEEARQLLDDVLARQPAMVAALVERGKFAVRTRELDSAERFLQGACKRDPGNYEAHYQLMQCYRGQGKRKEADAALEKMNRIKQDSSRLREIAAIALSLRPRDPDLHAEVGEILMRLGVPEQGQRWLESALQFDPHHAAATQGLARYYQSLGQTSKAEHYRQSAADPAKATR